MGHKKQQQMAPTEDMVLKQCPPTGKWKQEDLVYCHYSKGCMFTWCCPCIQLQRNVNRYKYLHEGEHKKDLNSSCGLYCCAFTCSIGWLHWAATTLSRRKIREARQIDGNIAEDALVGWCCAPCSIDQERVELETELQALRIDPKDPPRASL